VYEILRIGKALLRFWLNCASQRSFRIVTHVSRQWIFHAKKTSSLPGLRAVYLIVLAFHLPAPQRVLGAVAGMIGINEAIGQVSIAAFRDAQAGGLDNGARAHADIFEREALRIELRHSIRAL